ncbi:MAG TPA: BlaI/MecI/CopY family transcriptional regulator [Candidatus Aminicenantes bacterium]|nr:BlaI/MecI/CopY family transcriptional regulator [Candidatus Aminicenantes bacterium]
MAGNDIKPTAAELEVLNVLWAHGPSTVRFVNDKLNEEKVPKSGSQSVGYTTTLKIMQIMAEKGLLKRDESQRSHLYGVALPQARVQKALLDRLLETAFGGSALKLVMQALGGRKATPEEISRIRELLDNMERGGK